MKVLSKYFGNAGIYLGANILNAGIPLILMPVLTRLLSPADYGIIAMFAIALSIIGAFVGLGVHGAVSVRFFQLDKQSLGEFIGACIFILAASTLIVLLIVAILGGLLEDLTGIPVNWLLAAVVFSSFQFLGNIRLALWQASGDSMRYGSFQISQSLVNAVVSIVLILFIGMAWEGRLLGQGIASIGFGMISIFMLKCNDYLRMPSNWKKTTKGALNFGVPLIPHSLGSLALASSGQVLSNQLFDSAQAGIYAVSIQIGALVGIVADAFVKTYGPWLYRQLENKNANTNHLIVGSTYLVFLFFIILSAASALLLVLVTPIFLGHKFISAIEFIPPIVFGYGFTGMYYAVAGFYFFTSNTKFVSAVTLVSCVGMIGAMVVLAGVFGPIGIAYGYAFGQFLMLIIALLISNKIFPMPWVEIRPAIRSVWVQCFIR